MKISAVWITKNEAQNLKATIESVKDAVDELVVVDTGSADDTVKIAKSYGARVEHFDWVDDFSAARNYALSQVDPEAGIIIFLDGDEWFEPKLDKSARKQLEKLFADSKVMALRVSRTNVDPEAQLVISVDKNLRILRGGVGIRYAGTIHEQPRTAEGGFLNQVSLPGLMTYHSGYGAENTPEKMRRNKLLLEKAVATLEEGEERVLDRFYLLRESRGLGENNQAFEMLQWLLDHPEETHRFMRTYPSLGYSFVQEAIRLAAVKSHRVSRRQLWDVVVEPVARLCPDWPARYTVELYYSIYFDNDEARLLARVDECVAKAETLRRPDTEEFTEEYLRMNVEIYTAAGRAAWRWGKRELAFDYAGKALRQSEGYVNPASVSLLLRCVKGLPAADVVLFLSSVMQTDKRGTLEMLLALLQHEGYKEVYSYFAKKLLDAGQAKKSDFWFLMMVLGSGAEAARSAWEARESTDADVVRRTLFLAILCTADEGLYKNYRGELQEYDPVLQAFFADGGLARDTDLKILTANYQPLAFAAGRDVANRLLRLFTGEERLAWMQQYDYYMAGGLYAELLAESEWRPPAVDLEGGQMLAETYLMAGQHEEAMQLLRSLPREAGLSDVYFNLCLAMQERAEPAYRAEAKTYWEKYHGQYEEWVDARDAARTARALPEDSNQQRATLKKMTAKQLAAWTDYAPDKPFSEQLEGLRRAAALYGDEGCYWMAVRCCARLLSHQYRPVETIEVLAHLFQKAGNAALAKQLKAQVADEQKKLDDSFEAMLQAAVDEEEVLRRMRAGYDALGPENQNRLEAYVRRYGFWGSLDGKNGDFDLLQRRADVLHQHKDDFAWLYGRLGDYGSRHVLHALLANWLDFDMRALLGASDSAGAEYFDRGILRCGPGEVVVDAGAYNGDTVWDYLTVYGKDAYQHIYCYEIAPDAFEKLTKRLGDLPEISLRPLGLADKAGSLYLDEGAVPSGGKLTEKGRVKVETVALDVDVVEEVTLLKMDVEGAEKVAIRGAAKHIADEKPKLALSVYHGNTDIYEIPRLVDEICPGYQFYLQSHSGNLIPTELSLLAVHPEGKDTTR